MADEPLRRVERVVTTYDVTWLLDLHKNGQLNLDPSYQRKSVWTPKDRRFFMDTVFRNYPSPAIFLHKTIDDSTGSTTYHVVDGKQRILTILMFVQSRFSLASDFGDQNFNGKRWRDFDNTPSIKRLLWNYRITIEELDDTSLFDINDVFSRLNKNANKLTPQELRHARFDGWLITFLEAEAQDDLWKSFKIRTAAKEKRMADVQNLAELAAVILRNDVSGFSQDDLDQLFADHDDPSGEESEFDTEAFVESFLRVRGMLARLEAEWAVVSSAAQPFFNFYTLWAALTRNLVSDDDLQEFAKAYVSFMEAVKNYQLDEAIEDAPEFESLNGLDLHIATYKAATLGATTEEPQRRERLKALEAALFPLSSSNEN
ncbi:DUF262 domain-containing protein [Paenarthrobacter sp. NPDC090517]|uniref:DUF262 domain-containing protein n=1 Tax=Paenarthrobacter sp. NPDC090517 TaxID=3364381 RepID=UPI003813B6A0